MPAASANRVRIIGGMLRGRIIRFPSAPGLRPTPDRVRETLFNWLGQTLEGLKTLDLFAGTGPPFDSREWEWLLPSSAARLTEGGRIYAESPVELAPPRPLATYRHDRAGRVHYHLFAKPGSRLAAADD